MLVREPGVYPDFDSCLTDFFTPDALPGCRKVGGIDWGFHNPFAAVWGVLDERDVLWINHERYEQRVPLHQHFKHLPRKYVWFADPAGRTEIEEARAGGFKVIGADNSLKAGIAAVTARLQTGWLKVRGACINVPTFSISACGEKCPNWP